MADKYLADIKQELLSNELLIADYPMATKGEIWSVDTIWTKNNICVESLGKGKNARGRKFKGSRPTLILADDPQSNDDVDSASQRKKDMAWVERALLPSGDTYTNYMFVGNNIHRESIIGQLSKRSEFHLTKFESIIKWPTRMDLWMEWENLYLIGTDQAKQEAIDFLKLNYDELHKDSDVLWPEKEDLVSLMQMRAPNHAAFEAEKQNNPRDPSRCEFPEEWISDCTYRTLPQDHPSVIVGICDPSKGKNSKKGDYAPILTLHYYPALNKCYLECDIKRRPLTEIVNDIFEWCSVYRYIAFGIESNGFQELLSEELINKVMENKGILNVVPIENYGVSKVARISRLSVWLKRKFFLFKEGCPYTDILLNQLLDFPYADHDDGPDALEMGLRVLTNYVNIGTVMENGVNGDIDSEIEDDIIGYIS
jgi:predicted phage terminase large subunit-like protein